MNNYIIAGKEYTREELLEFGKKRYPKFYWIKRGFGIGLMSIFGLLAICSLILVIEFSKTSDDSGGWLADLDEYMIQTSTIFSCIFGFLFVAGLALFIVSFVEKNDDAYVKRAIKYYAQQAEDKTYREAQEIARKEQEELNALIKYKRQRDSGVITQEEYEAKKKELLK